MDCNKFLRRRAKCFSWSFLMGIAKCPGHSSTAMLVYLHIALYYCNLPNYYGCATMRFAIGMLSVIDQIFSYFQVTKRGEEATNRRHSCNIIGKILIKHLRLVPTEQLRQKINQRNPSNQGIIALPINSICLAKQWPARTKVLLCVINERMFQYNSVYFGGTYIIRIIAIARKHDIVRV